MTTPFIRFGDPTQFEIAARWSPDTETRECLPLAEGWSAGELRLTVCGQVLTEHRLHGNIRKAVSWYLSPVLDWLIRNWTWLLHEERYGWTDRSGQPAAVAAFAALERTIAATDEAERRTYADVHAWWSRHALRAADASALYPDVYIRRVANDIEVSWLARQPAHAPDSFTLVLAPGYALLPVSAVAEPLWQFLSWAIHTAPAGTIGDGKAVADLENRFSALSATPLSQLEQTYVGEHLQDLLNKARAALPVAHDGVLATGLPVIETLDAAVLMFGGVNVDLGQSDVESLLSFIGTQRGLPEAPNLSEMVQNPENEAWSLPYEEGYRLAEECRDALGIDPAQIFVDMEAVLSSLEIRTQDVALETSAIRGVAVAGVGYGPAVLVNISSFYNNNAAGRRFTLAHELCHILYDRTRARRLSHLSGPWASARTEKRANAFAAMFLAPPSAIRRALDAVTLDAVKRLAAEVGMSPSALIEHLCNVGLINDAARDELRQG